MTNTLETTSANQTRLAQASAAWRDLLAESLRRGFHGSATLEVIIQDGTIQHIRRKIEQIEK